MEVGTWADLIEVVRFGTVSVRFVGKRARAWRAGWSAETVATMRCLWLFGGLAFGGLFTVDLFLGLALDVGFAAYTMDVLARVG